MAYRATVHSSTGVSPMEMFLGFKPKLPIDLMYPSPEQTPPPTCPQHYILWLQNTTQNAHDVARENLKRSVDKQKRNHDKHLCIRKYHVGDKVWRWYPPSANKKLGKGWIGPFIVKNVVNDLHYEISLQNGEPVRVHVDHLKPCYSN